MQKTEPARLFSPNASHRPLSPYRLDAQPVMSLEAALARAREDKDYGTLAAERDVETMIYYARRGAEKIKRKDPSEMLTVDEIAAIQVYTQESPL